MSQMGHNAYYLGVIPILVPSLALPRISAPAAVTSCVDRLGDLITEVHRKLNVKQYFSGSMNLIQPLFLVLETNYRHRGISASSLQLKCLKNNCARNALKMIVTKRVIR